MVKIYFANSNTLEQQGPSLKTSESVDLYDEYDWSDDGPVIEMQQVGPNGVYDFDPRFHDEPRDTLWEGIVAASIVMTSAATMMGIMIYMLIH